GARGEPMSDASPAPARAEGARPPPAEAPEGYELESLLRLQWRVVWAYPPRLPRWRFHGPRVAGLQLSRPRPVEQEPTGEPDVSLTSLEKYVLYQRAGGCCHWCHRQLGTTWTVEGHPTVL